jgi:agmatinase
VPARALKIRAPRGSLKGSGRPVSARSGPTVALLGLPTDVNSSHVRGAALGPGAVRKALWSGASNLTSERGVDLSSPEALRDEGDLRLHEDAADRERIEVAVADLLDRGLKPLLLGGDHSVTYPVLRAMASRRRPLSILHFDAHPDLYDEYEGNRFSHASPFARIMEEGLAKRLVQAGIRTKNAHQAAQAKRFGVTMVTMSVFDPQTVPIPRGPLYISIDLDALDPAFAPGVAHREPGGLSVRDIISVLHRVKGPVVGADIVELRPASDVDGMTAGVAAKLLKELAGLMRS